MKKIIFGAGNYGRMAFEYYGEGQVEFFVDNNPAKAGKEWCGKKILSFEQYLGIQAGYDLVIAVSAYVQIAKQLQDAGITSFSYFSPQYHEALARIKEKSGDISCKVGFFGLDECTDVLIRDVMQNGIAADDIYMISDDNDAQIDSPGIHYAAVQDVRGLLNTVIISSPKRSYILQAKLNFLKNEGIRIINPFIPQKYYETKEVVFNPYGISDDDLTEEEWNERNGNHHVIDEINEYAEELSGQKPLFEFIEIETVNRCNGTCDFCPVSVRHDVREKKYMDERLFQKIIGELAEINYSGWIALFSNNEPFLDSRILEFHRYARERLPHARFHLFTNGTLLTLDKFITLMQYLDELIIDNYNQELQLNKYSREIAEYCESHEELKERVTIVLRKPHEIMTSRGGDAPNRSDIPEYPTAKCVLPFMQMIVRPDGKLSLCCNDPYGKTTLGDLNEQTVLEAWYGEKYEAVRKTLLTGRGNYPHCVKCDTFYIY